MNIYRKQSLNSCFYITKKCKKTVMTLQNVLQNITKWKIIKYIKNNRLRTLLHFPYSFLHFFVMTQVQAVSAFQSHFYLSLQKLQFSHDHSKNTYKKAYSWEVEK